MPDRPKIKHTKGANVTAHEHQFMGKVIDHHFSYTVRRKIEGTDEYSPFAIVAAEDELRDDDEVLTGQVSYLVERNWDGVHVWMTEHMLTGGHLTTHDSVKQASR
jgi:hypothetical protein